MVLGDRYTVAREIGRGGMATVWLASDAQHGRDVAIKTLHPELAGAVGTDRFLREIRLTAQLQHPGIVPILDSGSYRLPDGTTAPWYAMPYLAGESLRARLNRASQLPIDEALRITEGVGRALEAAHERGVVHRDIKPENVFLSGNQVYVVDFGIARAVATTDAERLTNTGLAIGTPTYMSPEQALAGRVDARSDQYSLASMLYEMLAGEPPFAGPNQSAIIARRLAEPARPISTVRSTVPPQVERAILRALERTPADRFPTIGAFLDALRAPAPREIGFRRPRWSVVVATAALVLLAVAAWALNRPKPVDPEVLALYQRGVRGYDRRNAAGAIDAIRALSETIQRDSSFAPAWNALAKTYVRSFERGFQVPVVHQVRMIPLANEAVDRALELDRDNADTWTTRAIVSFQIAPWDLETPRRSLERSLALDSLQHVAWHFLARVSAEKGDLPAALDAWRRSVHINPTYTQGLTFLALGHYWHGAYDSAAVWADSALRLDDSYTVAHHAAAQIEVERGRFSVAEDHGQAALRLSEDVEAANSHAILAQVKARAGNRNLGNVEILVTETTGAVYLPLLHTAVYLAEAKLAVGDVSGALKALGRYATQRDMHYQLHIRCSPTFAPLEQDSSFRALLRIPRPPRGTHC